MVVMVMENAPEGLRGELTRWMLETKAGVFVGTVSATVRDRLWDKVTTQSIEGGAIMIYSSDTEQGFRLEMHGSPRRQIIDIEGVYLIKTL